MVDQDAVEQPVRYGARRRHAQNLETGQCQARRASIVRQARRIEDIEAARAAETEPPVAHSMECVEIEFLALQTALAMQRLDRTGIGIEAHQPRIAAEPKAAGGIGEHAIDGVARQAVIMRY